MTMMLLYAVCVLLLATSGVAFGPQPELCTNTTYNLTGENFTFNSTGTVKVTFNDTNGRDPGTWYLSTTIKETTRTGRKNATSKISPSFDNKELLLEQFLSVPESWVGSDGGNNTSICVYTGTGINKTVEETGSCDGVVDDKCLKTMNKTPAPKNGSCDWDMDLLWNCKSTGFAQSNCM